MLLQLMLAVSHQLQPLFNLRTEANLAEGQSIESTTRWITWGDSHGLWEEGRAHNHVCIYDQDVILFRFHILRAEYLPHQCVVMIMYLHNYFMPTSYSSPDINCNVSIT